MSKSKIFCGIGNVPKGKKLGTARQCVDARQVRYYGFVGVPDLLPQMPERAIPTQKPTKIFNNDPKSMKKMAELEKSEQSTTFIDIILAKLDDVNKRYKLEAMKLQKKIFKIKGILNEVKRLNVIINAKEATPAQKRAASKKKETLHNKYIMLNNELQGITGLVTVLEGEKSRLEAQLEQYSKPKPKPKPKRKPKRKSVNYAKNISDTYKLLNQLEKKRLSRR